MMEKVKPNKLKGSPAQQQNESREKIPMINPATANPFVRGRNPYAEGAAVSGRMVAGVMGGAGAAGGAENSGRSEMVFQLVSPVTRTRVCALTRPCVCHSRNCSRLIGPYSRPSAPMILYMPCYSLEGYPTVP